MKLLNFSVYTDYYLDTVKSLEVEETTLCGYKNMSKHMKSFFRNKKINKISKMDIQMYLKYLKDHEYLPGKVMSVNTVRKHYDLLNQIFSNAVDEKIIKINPMSNVRKPRHEDYYCSVYNRQRILELLTKAEDTNIFIPIVLAVLLGLRRGEICGLKWEYVDFEQQCIFVKWTRTVAGSKIIEKETKTKKSTRLIAMGDFLTRILLEEYKRQQVYFKIANLQDRYVCIYKENGKELHPEYITNTFGKFLIKNDLKKIRFHDLRHSCASIANDNGSTLHDISSMLGHSSVTITSQIYIHLFNNTHKKVVSEIEKSILN